MFEQGFFSGDKSNPYQADGTYLLVSYHPSMSFAETCNLTPNIAEGLARVSQDKTASAMQVSTENPMVGIEGRTSLLKNLSVALKTNPTFFGPSARPGGLVGMAHILGVTSHSDIIST